MAGLPPRGMGFQPSRSPPPGPCVGVVLPAANLGGGMARRGMARARLPIAAASGGLVEETRLDGDLAQRDLDAAEVGLHDGQQVGQGARAMGAGLVLRTATIWFSWMPERSSGLVIFPLSRIPLFGAWFSALFSRPVAVLVHRFYETAPIVVADS